MLKKVGSEASAEVPQQEVKEEQPKVVIKVVKEIPVQEVREQTLEDGTVVRYITTEEALEAILNS